MLPLLSQGTPESLDSTIGQRSTRHVSKPPRKQVSRACDHCRLRRVKCDHGRPCRPCRQKGLACNSRGAHNDEARTLPQALREIERLRTRVLELEAQLEDERQQRGPEPPRSHSQPSSSTTITPASSSSTAHQSPVDDSSEVEITSVTSKKGVWEGIYTATARSEQTSYYGPSSAIYFIGRIGSHLSKSLQQSFNAKSMQPKGINRTLISPTSPDDGDHQVAHRGELPKPCMSRTQEEYFLSLFWESHHANVPIIAEDEFRKLYDSLWQTSEPYRKPSALVDIILAICMQYGWAFLLQDVDPDQSKNYDDASIAGRLYYRRSQHLLASQLESPSITTLQCHLYSVIYLCCASFQNMAHTTLAVAIRTAQILGLHLEPPESMPLDEKELRKRLWALTYNIEAKTCMKLGRPFSVQESQITVSIFSDSIEAASFFGSSLRAYDEKVTWLTYSSETSKFLNISVHIYHQLYAKFAEVLGSKDYGPYYKDPQKLEICGELLTGLTSPIKDWIDQLPDGIKLKRRGDSEPLSTDRSPILIETTAPIWLQRHRICLELIYHTILSNLYRPFITFTPSSLTPTPISERLATACAAHAIAHTHIMHQVLKETDLMNGWQEFFLWQWNATVNMVGFVLAYPVHHGTVNARRAIDKAVEVFEVFGCHFAVAASAAAVTRELVEKADLLTSRLRDGINSTACIKSTDAVSGSLGDGMFDTQTSSGGGLPDLDLQDGSSFSEFMDWALTVDSFNSFEDLFADANAGTDWWGVSS